LRVSCFPHGGGPRCLLHVGPAPKADGGQPRGQGANFWAPPSGSPPNPRRGTSGGGGGVNYPRKKAFARGKTPGRVFQKKNPPPHHVPGRGKFLKHPPIHPKTKKCRGGEAKRRVWGAGCGSGKRGGKNTLNSGGGNPGGKKKNSEGAFLNCPLSGNKGGGKAPGGDPPPHWGVQGGGKKKINFSFLRGGPPGEAWAHFQSH